MIYSIVKTTIHGRTGEYIDLPANSGRTLALLRAGIIAPHTLPKPIENKIVEPETPKKRTRKTVAK